MTGANGFIGSHILQLLEKSIFVQAIVHSEAKASRVRKDFPSFGSSKLDFSIVPDITAPGAFDRCLEDSQPLDAIIHNPASREVLGVTYRPFETIVTDTLEACWREAKP